MTTPRAFALPIVTALVCAMLLVVFETCSCAQRTEADPRSIEWVCARAPERVRALFDSMSLDRPGLEVVKHAVRQNDLPAACAALLQYYRDAPTARWLRHPVVAPTDVTSPNGEKILTDTYSFDRVEGRVPRRREGRIDWSYDGPRNDPEWGFGLNAHHHFNTLTQAYLKTGQRRYVERIDADVRDWILANPAPARLVRGGPWRGLTTASRAHNWMYTFYALQPLDEFSPAARILMLSSLAEHARYLMLFHRREAGNWVVAEMEGLACVGAAWPEFSDAPGWRGYALDTMGTEAGRSVYPDGAQVELTAHYHRITTDDFSQFVDTYRQFGYAVPDSLRASVERLWSYLALTVRPDGTMPQNNDSDRRDIRDRLAGATKSLARPDWLYTASNGAEGEKPAVGPSITFPWAGQAVMRSGWDADAHWSFFDIGPAGTAHQHRDKLHLSIDAFGRALLVDTGRYTYDRGPWRDYFTGSRGHNVLLIDGKGQKLGPERAVAPVAPSEYGSTPEWDFARGVFDAGFGGVGGQAVHTRTVLYVRNEFWVVADRVETDRPRTIDALWHFAPDCHVVLEGRTVASRDAGLGNLRVTPVGGMGWKPSILSGRERPEIQGWYSPAMNEKVPAPVAVYTAEIPGTTTFAWVLLPAKGDVGKVDARVISSRADRIELRVQTRPEDWFVITIPMNAWRPSVRRER